MSPRRGIAAATLALALALALGAPTAFAQTPTAQTPAAQTPAAQTAADDEAAKMAELFGEDGTGGAPEPRLKLYGFADFNVTRWLNLTDKWQAQFPDRLAFFVGRLNLYMEGNIAPDWKSLIEVRYMFIPSASTIPNGATPTSFVDPIANSGRYNGITADYTDFGRPVEWNGINIQRAYLEHNFNNFLSLRVGRFLTPWGIWNVDHGSPVIIGTAKPFVIGEVFFPEAQTGFDAFGSIPVGNSGTLGYHLTLSNGRGPTEAFSDLDSNKALGGRLTLKMYLLGVLDVGISGYGGTFTDRRQQVNLVSQTLFYFTYEHYREVSWAADVRWLWKSLHFQTEAAVHDRVWDDDARPVSYKGAGIQTDFRRFGMYALLGYRLPWLNLMPYGMFSYYDTGSRAAFGGGASRVNVWSAGVNIRIHPSVVFKAEYQIATFMNVAPGAMFAHSLEQLSSQLAWAF